MIQTNLIDNVFHWGPNISLNVCIGVGNIHKEIKTWGCALIGQ